MTEYPSLLSGIDAELRAAAHHLGLPRRAINAPAQALHTRIREQFGGEQWYVHAPDVSERKQADLDALARGDAPEAICRRFGISRRWLRKLSAEAQANGNRSAA